LKGSFFPLISWRGGYMSIDYRKKKFLIIDDFHDFRTSLRYMMESFGVVAIDGVGNAEVALNFIESRSYDVILCDYNLGVNQKDGQQILEEIKFRELIKLSTVFIMISAENMAERIMGVVEHYPDDYLIKPFTKEVLKSRIDRAILKKEDFEIVESAVQKKEYLKAVALCDQQIQKNPPNLYEYKKLKGELFLKSEDYRQAQKLYEEVLAIRDLPWAQFGLGRALYYLEEYGKAREKFSALIQENNMHVVAYDWLAKTLVKMDAPAEAESILQEAIEISPKSLPRQRILGEIAFDNKNLPVSERAFKAAIEYGKNSCFKTPEVYTRLAKVLVEKNEPERGLAILKEVIEEFQENQNTAFEAMVTSGDIYRMMDKVPEAQKSLKAATRLYMQSEKQIPASQLLETVRLCFTVMEKESGLNLVQEVIRNNHEDELMLKEVQSLFDEFGLTEEGTHLIESVRKEVAQINNKGVKLVESGQLKEAIESFEEAAQKLPGNKTILANTARALLLYVQKNGTDKALLNRAMKYITSLQKVDPEYQRIPVLLALHEEMSKL
jgi:tetratricopeptide (TPR) repeat protein